MKSCKKCLSINTKSKTYWLMFPLKLILGAILVYHGYLKIFTEGGMEGFSGFLESLNIFWPVFFAWVVGLIEFLGGIAIILGLLTPIVTTLVAIEFLVIFLMKLTGKIEAEYFVNMEFDLLILASAATLWWIAMKDHKSGHKN